ncbi:MULTISPECIES: hypothetical protein [Hyphobacterium]|uniref:DUF4142 domain-containing protein n=1 Tax=Hyphobacterium vulgare TaxID=1736751 RepID=A0ABV7A090_9PROT
MALTACVSTPQTASTADAVALTQGQSDLRTSSRQLVTHFQEAGWSANTGGSFGQLANMLLNGRSDTDAPTPSETYLARIASDNSDSSAIFTALDTDLATAAGMAGTVAVNARAIGEGGAADTAALAGDLTATEDAIASVSRALDFFDQAMSEAEGRIETDQVMALRARYSQLRTEFDRLGESADAIADRRRAVRSGAVS